MKERIAITILLTFSIFASAAQDINIAKLDSFLHSLAARNMAMGSLTISKNGNIKYQKAMGYAVVTNENKITADTETKYRIGSVTKLFTSAMILQLVEEGKLKLDQKLSYYFPTLPNSNKITIQNMLYHRSGLHDYTHDTDFTEWMDKPKSHEELLTIIEQKGSDFEPNTQADYCNSNFLILGYIIEKICKTSYAEALKARIISKINLKDTYYGKPIAPKDHECFSYKYSNRAWMKEKETDLSIHGGAGSIVSTPTDMVKFIDALFAGKIISKSSLTKMTSMVDDYGMGIFQNKYGDRPSFGHNGRIEEFYSAVWHFPKEGFSLSYCTNGINYPRVDIIEGILKICFNEPFVIPFTQKKVASDGLDKYLGNYSSGQIRVSCTKQGDKLFLETRGQAFETEKIGVDYFMNSDSGYFFEFHPDKEELLIKETDNVYVLKRTK